MNSTDQSTQDSAMTQFLTPVWSLLSYFKSRTKSTVSNSAQRLARRIVEIRGLGSQTDDGLMLFDGKISADDYFLMGCDNSCAARNFPNVLRDQLCEGRWFAGGSDLGEKQAGYNYHGTQRKDGSWEIDSFYATLPSQEYQADPKEVAWHYIRVKELFAAGMPKPERIQTMKSEAATKPWLVGIGGA